MIRGETSDTDPIDILILLLLILTILILLIFIQNCMPPQRDWRDLLVCESHGDAYVGRGLTTKVKGVALLRRPATEGSVFD